MAQHVATLGHLLLVSVFGGGISTGSFASEGLLVQKGARLDISTDSASEAHRLASALKTCLRSSCLAIEQVTGRVLHTLSVV